MSGRVWPTHSLVFWTVIAVGPVLGRSARSDAFCTAHCLPPVDISTAHCLPPVDMGRRGGVGTDPVCLL